MTSEYTWLDRVEDDALLRRAIDEQEGIVRRLEAARGAAAEGASALAAEEAAYNLHQARRYLDELRADLKEVADAPVDSMEGIPAPRRRREAPMTRSGLAVVIGHSPEGDMGALGISPPFPAEATTGKAEYYWNKEVAEWIKADLAAQGVRCEIFHRLKNKGPGILEAYRQVKEWGPAAAVELHFNSHDGTARGAETLYELADSRTWAGALQKAMIGLYGHEGKLSERGSKLDRGVKKANGRGSLSLTQIAPSALTEPFFADNGVDADLGTSKKRDLAAAIVSAFLQFSGAQPGASAPPVASGPPPSPAEPVPAAAPAASLWDRVRAAYETAPIEFPRLKGITYAQWGYESGHGTSLLAREHLNFGGLKYRDFLADIAASVPYTDSGGRRDNYCKFATFENFFKGYWNRFDKISNYDGWRDHAATPDSYIRFIANIYAPPSENANYLRNVLSVYERYKANGKLPVDKPAAPPPAATEPAPAAPPPPATEPAAPPVTPPSAEPAPAATPPPVATEPTATSVTPPSGEPAPATTPPPAATEPAPPPATAEPAPPAPAETAPSAAPDVDLAAAVRRAAPADAQASLANFNALVAAYSAATIAHPALKAVTLAQWANESNWGRSKLADSHFNFAGIEWSDAMIGLAAPVDYARPDDTGGRYCRFFSLDTFISGYWARLDRDPRFAGWEAAAGSPQAFLEFIAPRWRPGDAGYARGVSNVLDRMIPPAPAPVPAPAAPAPGAATSPAPAPATPPAPSAGTTSPAAPAQPGGGTAPDLTLDGFVLRVDRVRTESRQGRARTVGLYRAFFNREPLPGLEGVCLEQKGPGDNTSTGGVYDRRVTAGAYPLLTHGGQGFKYATHGYSSGTSRPKPAIRLGNTGARVAILFHPGGGFLSSEGCLNLCGPMSSARDSMDFMESRGRVIAMIEAMKQKLGDGFPKTNGQPIPGAWMVLVGEPGEARKAEDRWRDLAEDSPEARDARGRRPEGVEAPLSESERYELIAAAMNGQVLPEKVSLSLFDSLTRGRDDLAETRNDDGENLWREWASGWQSSFAIADIDERARVQSDLAAIAGRLRDAGVGLNDPKGRRTPLTAAAGANQWEALAYLHDQGADLDLHDKAGDTPLTIAAYQGALEAVEFLMGAGANESATRREPGDLALEGASDGPADEAAPSGATALACARTAREMADTASRAAVYDRIIAGLGE